MKKCSAPVAIVSSVFANYTKMVCKKTIKCKNSKKNNIKTQLNHNTVQINKPEGRKPNTAIAPKQ